MTLFEELSQDIILASDMREKTDEIIVGPLMRFIEGKITHKEIDWNAIYRLKDDLLMTETDKMIFHEALRPFYKKYLLADEGILNQNGWKVESFLCSNLTQCPFLEGWFGDMDIMEIADAWAARFRVLNWDRSRFFSLLSMLQDAGFTMDWESIYQKVNERLKKSSCYGDYMSAELYCILSALTQINRMQGLTQYRKAELVEDVRRNWSSLRHIYSVLLHRIVGTGHRDFAAIANNVITLTGYHSRIHLFYNAMVENMDKVATNDDVRHKIERKMHNIEEIIKSTPQENDLDELCQILFPKVFTTVLNRDPFKSYDDLSKENQLLNDKLSVMVEEMNNNMNSLVQQMKLAAEASVSMEFISAELLKLPPDLSWHVFTQLNSLLIGNLAWEKSVSNLKDKILALRVQNNTNNFYSPIGQVITSVGNIITE